MLLLVLKVGGDRYALDVRQIVEVLPMVSVSPIPLAREDVAGVIEYRGAQVPVVDMSQWLCRRPSPRRLSTRMILVHHPDSSDRLVGLIVEKTTETMRREASDFVDASVGIDMAPYSGPVTRDAQGLVQWLDLGRLLKGRLPVTPSVPLPDSSWTTSYSS
jgi:chemotaxis-related protein WspB